MFKDLFNKMVDFVLSFSRAGFLVTNAKIPLVNDHIVIVSRSLDDWHKILIDDCLKRYKDVYLVTNHLLGESNKDQIAEWALVEDYSLNKYQTYTVMGYFLLYVGLGLFALSLFMGLFIKIDNKNDILRIFLPLLIAYIGLWTIEFLAKKGIKMSKVNSHFHLILEKSKLLPSTGQFLFIDNQTLYVIVKEENSEFFRVNNSVMFNEFVDCLNHELRLEVKGSDLKKWILK